MMEGVRVSVLFTVTLMCFGCRSEQTDWFSGGCVLIDNGRDVPYTVPLSPEEKRVLNAYIAENTSCWNKSYVTCAPMGVTLQSPRAKICITSHRIILSVKHGADGAWSQYEKTRDKEDALFPEIYYREKRDTQDEYRVGGR